MHKENLTNSLTIISKNKSILYLTKKSMYRIILNQIILIFFKKHNNHFFRFLKKGRGKREEGMIFNQVIK